MINKAIQHIGILFFCVLSSCEGNILIDNYQVVVDGGMKRLVGKNVIKNRSSIYPNIIDIKQDNNFVVVKQVPNYKATVNFLSNDLYNIYCLYSNYVESSTEKLQWEGLQTDSILFNIFKSRGATTNNGSDDIKISLGIADSLLKNDASYKCLFKNEENYWIINVSKDKIIGPFTKEEYSIKEKELNIPAHLHLN